MSLRPDDELATPSPPDVYRLQNGVICENYAATSNSWNSCQICDITQSISAVKHPLTTQQGDDRAASDLGLSIAPVREIGSSGYGVTRLLRRGDVYFVGKYLNGTKRTSDFGNATRPFLTLSHRFVMPIDTLIPPTTDRGPIVITAWNQFGSLSDFLRDGVASGDAVRKTKIVYGIMAGMAYLHAHNIIHHELKPSNILIQPDGTPRICGYMTSFLTERKFIAPSRLGSPCYSAPETFDDDEDDLPPARNPKSDVFTFGLILYEVLHRRPVFGTAMSAARIMRFARDDKQRQPIGPDVPEVLAEMIRRTWLANPDRRPTFQEILRGIDPAHVEFFPGVAVDMT